MTNDSIPNFTASFAVYNTNNQEIVGIYNTNSNNGNFLMALMPCIKYEIVLECDGYKEHTAYITVPEQTELFALLEQRTYYSFDFLLYLCYSSYNTYTMSTR